MSFTTEDLNQALIADIGRTKQPTDDSSSSHWAAYMLQTNITRKFTTQTTSKLAESNALKKFMQVNSDLLKWEACSEGTANYEIFERFRKLCRQQFYNSEGSAKLDVAKAFNVGMVGPGASIGATDENFIDKLFNSKLTCTTPILYKYYLQAICNCKPWRKAEIFRQRLFGEYDICEGNKLFFVAKETIIARTAATEGTLNMFGQLGYGSLICTNLLTYHDIDLSIQQNVNKWFARSGSLTGEYATIDLSSASDTIGLRFIREYCPSKMVRDLELLRSSVSMIKGKAIELNMISTMGNGFTFPLQTWIFANLVLATMLETGEPVFDIYGKRRYSVYGDDIIVPVKVYDKVVSVLSSAGFTVNVKKSFATGGFRESCGGDFFKGVNVRAVYLHKCTDGTHIYGLLNKLIEWSGVHKIPLPQTCKYLLSLVEFRPIPYYWDENSGVRVPISRLRNRKVSKHGHFIFYARERVEHKIKPEPHIVEKYYHAFHVAFVHGTYRNGFVTPRVKPGHESFKVVKRAYSTYWEYAPDSRLTIEERRNAFELNCPIRSV